MAKPYWQNLGLNVDVPQAALPARVDVLIVGAGYTGLSAARETASAGATTLVLEAGALGAGCSGRNGGQVAYSIKPSLATLSSRHGVEKAFAICQEGRAAVEYLKWLATEQGLDCGWRQDGLFYGAHTPRHFAAMVREAADQPPGLAQNIVVVPKGEHKREIDTDFYHGGCLYPDDASVDPMRLLLALLRRAHVAGATVLEQCPALSIKPRAEGFEVMTPRGPVRAGQGVDRHERLLRSRVLVASAAGDSHRQLSNCHRSVGRRQGACADPERAQYRRLAARRGVLQALRRR